MISVFVTCYHRCRYCNGGRPALCQSSETSWANGTLIRGARRLGATDTFLAGNADVGEEIKQATGGRLDFVTETAGSIPAMNLAYAIAARDGVVISAGLPASNATFSYLHSALVPDGKSILGLHMGGCAPKRDIPRFIGLYQHGKLPMQKPRSGTISFDETNEGFDRLSDGGVLRQVPQPHA